MHDTEKAHFFSSVEQSVVREWMKALMKATIGRDYSRKSDLHYLGVSASFADTTTLFLFRQAPWFRHAISRPFLFPLPKP